MFRNVLVVDVVQGSWIYVGWHLGKKDSETGEYRNEEKLDRGKTENGKG